MNKLFRVLLLLVVGLSLIGVYRGWFVMDRKKLEQDEQTVQQEAHDIEHKVQAKIGDQPRPLKNQK